MNDDQAAVQPLSLKALGEMLKTARQAAGLSVEEAAHKLLLSHQQLEGLEEGVLSSFYSPFYYRKAVAKYLALVQLEVDLTTVEGYVPPAPIAIPVALKPNPEGLSKKRSGASAGRASSVLIALVLVALMVAGGLFWLSNHQPSPAAVNPAEALAPAPLAVPAVAAESPAAVANPAGASIPSPTGTAAVPAATPAPRNP